MRYKKTMTQLAMIGLIAAVTAGCSAMPFHKGKDNAQSNASTTSSDVTVNVNDLSAKAPAASGKSSGNTADTANGITTTLYFKDPNGLVAPVTMDLPKTPSIGKEALAYMVQGGPESSILPAGFSALLPKGTTFDMNITQDKTAIVNFNKSFANYNKQDERKILEAITWTLTSFPTVDNVQLWMNGRKLKQMPAAGTPLDEPLTRTMGINLEREPGVDFGQTIPVTLYFMNETKDQFKYYVPVTRMIKETNNTTLAAMQQLIQGPEPGDGLLSPLNSGLQVESVKETNGLMVADFNSSLLDAAKKAPADEMQSILLSLTANTNATKVQITVDGKPEAISSDNQNYSKPVTRPDHVNRLKM